MGDNLLQTDRMITIIRDLMSGDNGLILKATADLEEASKRWEVVQVLCHILVESPEIHVRQYSALLLKRNVTKKRQWKIVPLEQQQIIKQSMINALMREEEDIVRRAIVQVVGVLCKRSPTYINEVWEFIASCCSSPDSKQSELGSSVFAILAETVPDQFSPHIGTVCEMLLAALRAHEAAGNMATNIICNIMCGMSVLVPYTLAHNTAEQLMQQAVPLLVMALQAFACQAETDRFMRAFDIFENMLEYNPKFLDNSVKMLTEFCLDVSRNRQLGGAVRLKAIEFVSSLVQVKNKMLIKLELIESIINVVFNLLATEPADDDGDYLPLDAPNIFMTSASTAMDVLALNIPAPKLIPPLWALLGSTWQGQDPLSLRAVYMTMALITEGCSETICSQYLEEFVTTVKVGLTNATPSVRNAAFYALGQFAEHLQPDVSKFSSQIMPILLEYLQRLCNELTAGTTEPVNIECMFYAIKTFCEMLQDELLPYLPALMEILLEAIRQDNSVRVRELALSVVCAAAHATEENMTPYLPHLTPILQLLLAETDDGNINRLLPQSIDTLATLARAVGKVNFKPLTVISMNFALNLIAKADDSEVRCALYNLIGALATVINEEMESVFPTIIQHVFESFRSMTFPADDIEPNDIDGENDFDLDKEQSEDEEEDGEMHHVADDGVQNLNLEEKEKAILALKEFAEHTGYAFMPYLELSYQLVCKMINHAEEDIRKASVDALCVFIIALFEQFKEKRYLDLKSLTNAITSLFPKLKRIVHDDDEIGVVLSALEGVDEILRKLRDYALSSEHLCNCVFACIEDVIRGRASCQHTESQGDKFANGEQSAYGKEIFVAAVRILPTFGMSMTPERFVPYFERSFPIIVQRLQKAIEHNISATLRSPAYVYLADCFVALKEKCGAYFDTLCPVMLGGLSDKYDEARENAAYGLGELVLHSKESSYHAYPGILKALYEAIMKEDKPRVLDNICGAISRLITTNWALVPLAQVLPVYLTHLPLREDFSEYPHILECLNTLYKNAPDSISTNLNEVTAAIIEMLNQYTDIDKDACHLATNLLLRITLDHPEIGAVVVNSYPELTKFLQSILN